MPADCASEALAPATIVAAIGEAMPIHSLAQVINQTKPPAPTRWERRKYRHTAVFVHDELAHGVPLDRNTRAKLLYLAERLERRTKAPGRRNGALGATGLAVLRALLLRFANGRTGLCCPSYTALQACTGLCRQAIADALARLETTGIVKIVRRIARETITRVSAITGQPERIVTTVQQSNLYAFSEPADRAERLPLPPANARPFPPAASSACFSVSWEPSLQDRRKTNPLVISIVEPTQKS